MLQHERAPRAASHAAPAGVATPLADFGSNRDQADAVAGAASEGPFRSSILNAALGAAFGRDLDGLSVDWAADAETDAIGAAACTTGRAMSFGSAIDEDLHDPFAMEVVAHETAHALAGGGSGHTAIDQPGDAGEAQADRAGAAFAQWVAGGMRGPAPRLSPAAGGRAATHRYTATTLTGVPSLKIGSQGDQVELLQSLLNAAGANPQLLVDGDFGPKTDAGVRAYQTSHGLYVDGIVGPKTAASLNSGASSSASSSSASSSSASGTSAASSALTGVPSLRLGSQGGQVPQLQTLLTAAGFWCLVDGDFGPKTDGQVRAYQSSRGLLVDGVVGPITANALNTQAPAKSGGSSSSASSGGSSGATPSYDPAGRLNNSNVAPGLDRLARETCEDLQDEGHEPYIVSVYRSTAEQDALYAQGRTTPGSIVTWVDGGGSWHNYGCAVDIAFWNSSHTGPTWDWSYPWDRIGAVGLANGFTKWGGNWSDSPHLELHPTWSGSAYDLEGTLNSQGMSAVWAKVGAL